MIKINELKITDNGLRVAFIKTNRGSMVGRQRGLTVTEARHLSLLKDHKLPPVNFEHEFFEARKLYTEERTKDILSSPRSFQREVKALRPVQRSHEKLYCFFRPVLSNGFSPTVNIKKIFIDEAMFANYDGVVIPDAFEEDTKTFEKNLSQCRDYAEKDAVTRDKKQIDVIPQVTVFNKLDTFRKKLQLVKDMGFSSINILNGDVLKYYPQYTHLKEAFSGKTEIVIIGSQVPRKVTIGEYKISGPHYYSLFGQDVQLLEFKKPFLSDEDQKTPLHKKKINILLYDRKTNEVLSRGGYGKYHMEQLQFTNNPYTNGETLTSLFNKYQPHVLTSVSKIIEAVDGHAEMIMERDKILDSEREFVNYIKKKPCMRNIVDRHVLQKKLI
ncbi:hypothetical protein HYS50_02420 [Candidatus Woesearchaeota archaeon]|nr:hypothetical protein [Candidatus Woesearchaeota archaeon]